MPPSPTLVLTPHGVLRFEPREAEAALDARVARGAGHGLLQLGFGGAGTRLAPAFAFWQGFAQRFVAAFCACGRAEAIPEPSGETLAALLDAAPPMAGGEYLDAAALLNAWRAMQAALVTELAETGETPAAFLTRHDSRWRFVGRVHLNLAENRRDPDHPFAFMATYVPELGDHGALRHALLGQALRDYAGDRARLLALLEPLDRAAERLNWLKRIVTSGEIFHPLRWRPADAVRFLRDAAAMEEAGLIVRTPANWRMNRPSRPRVEATVGANAPARVGADALLDFDMRVSLDGETLNADEIAALTAATEGLTLLRGRWVEIDAEKLKATLDRFRQAQRLARREGLTFAQAMRLVAGVESEDGPTTPAADPTWAHVEPGPWLRQTLKACRDPWTIEAVAPDPGLKAQLRPYQETGVRWLDFLTRLRLGACLADDMGLGKTMQVLALLLTLRQRAPRGAPSLLVAPASLLANWAAEAARFAPDLRIRIAHPAFMPAAALKAATPETFAGVDLVATSYGALLRVEALAATNWRLVILDEAQAIKNPNARQTRAAKALRADARLALTGTPVENYPGDLWSIFDFLNPGLLGSSKAFASFLKRLSQGESVSYAPLRALVAPYILRRLKTDRSVIADLPDKTEVTAFCGLSRRQAALYQARVEELERQLADMAADMGDPAARRGLVLATLTRLKQICNHPAQGLDEANYDPADSGKFARLAEIAATVASRQDKMLVFTQFRQIIPALERLLAGVFGRDGLMLHGQTAVGERRDLVRRFQEDEGVPFFVLSLKAGGSGLNLTAASHVVHFDRWWNPAVESQATDRAFRIGQKRNVLVHKFVCRGTIEERIDALIDSKRGLAQDLLGAGAEINLTEMDDRQLLALVRLDLGAALHEG